MNKYVFAILLCIALLQCACNNARLQPNAGATGDLFAGAADTGLFIKNPAPVIAELLTDSACKNSTFIAVCTPLLVDSTVHKNEKAWFYLVSVKIDTVLKGPVYKGTMYFTTKKTPHFKLGTSGWMLFLNKQHAEKLLAYNGNVPWQWLENAPYIKITPALLQSFTPPVKVKKVKRRKKPRRPITLWVFRKNSVCPARLLL